MTDLDNAPAAHNQTFGCSKWYNYERQSTCVDGIPAAAAYRAAVGDLVGSTGYTFSQNVISVNTDGWRAVLEPFVRSVIQTIVDDSSLDVEVLLRRAGLNAYPWEIEMYLSFKQAAAALPPTISETFITATEHEIALPSPSSTITLNVVEPPIEQPRSFEKPASQKMKHRSKRF